MAVPSIGIVNLEDPSALYFTQSTKQKVYGYTSFGKAGKAAVEDGEPVELPSIPENMSYMTASNISARKEGITFDMSFSETSDKVMKVQAALPGAFNAYNLMASVLAVSSVTGLSYEEVASKIPLLTSVKGRMTVIDEGQPFEVIVDYAHTPSSFETIFPPVRKRCKGKMICVFGSGGERDLTKRPLQGELAAKYCDVVVLADEDPRGEDPVELLKMIAAGAEKEGKVMGKDLFIIHDRQKAIREVFRMAGPDDIVLLLGKSHENSIIYKDYVMPYDEISEAKKALGEIL